MEYSPPRLNSDITNRIIQDVEDMYKEEHKRCFSSSLIKLKSCKMVWKSGMYYAMVNGLYILSECCKSEPIISVLKENLRMLTLESEPNIWPKARITHGYCQSCGAPQYIRMVDIMSLLSTE